MGETEEPTPVDSHVFWEPARYSPDEIEAELPDCTRVRPVMQLGGRRLGSTRSYRPGLAYTEANTWRGS